jgi:Mg-chelatase subunit ChlD
MSNRTHIHILLDRSGSMAAIAPDVVGGFNTFLSEQQDIGADARITMVQFDSQAPHELLLAGAPIMEARPLDADTFRPRGGTPLLDATGRLIERGRLESQLRAVNGLPKEDIVFVSITDGEENQSREYTLERVRQLIKACEADGWTFVFLSAALDAYGEAGRLGVKVGATQAFEASGQGTRQAMHSLSEGMRSFRERRRMDAAIDSTDFFADGKPAEEAMQRPGAGHKA